MIVSRRIYAGIGSLDPQTVSTIASTIQQKEGYYPGSRAYRNNNPGNLMYAGQFGAIGADSDGFAVFPSYAAGVAALDAQIQLDASRGLTINQWMQKYAPVGSGNDPAAYAATIAAALGVSPDTLLADAGSGSSDSGSPGGLPQDFAYSDSTAAADSTTTTTTGILIVAGIAAAVLAFT